MKILQLLTTLKHGDAIGNHVFILRDIIKEMGYETAIYAEFTGPNIKPGEALSADRLPRLSKDDIVIYHLSTGTKLNRIFGNLECRKIMIYHNITPGHYFVGYDSAARMICRKGRRELQALAEKVDLCLAVSGYNKAELDSMGFKCRTEVLPIIIPFEDYKRESDGERDRLLDDNRTKILFVGRIAPNKCQEDVIRAFAEYKRNFDKDARLFLIGSSEVKSTYLGKLKEYVDLLGTEDVEFLSDLSFPALISYYKAADLFLCMSEHEGFCVPLLEAMAFDIPIIAYDAAAIPETLGGAGILLKEKDPVFTAAVMDRVIKDKELRNRITEDQRRRLEDFRYDKIRDRFEKLLRDFIAGS